MLVFRKYAKSMRYLFRVMSCLNMKVVNINGTTHLIHSFSCNRVGNRWRLEFVAEPYDGIPVLDIAGRRMDYFVYNYATEQERKLAGSPVFEIQTKREIPWPIEVQVSPPR